MSIVTWKTLSERIDAGRGQQHHDKYLPWIWIRRKNVSGQSNQVVDPMPGYRRGNHFLALVEWHVALLCIYLGVLDVREQFPLWPQEHQHPLCDYPTAYTQKWNHCRGLMEIADELNIDHGYEIGSDAPYVATLDIAATVRRKDGIGLAGLSLKPHELVLTTETDARINERLTLENVCLREYGASHKIVDKSILGPYTGGNLELLSSGNRLPAELRDSRLQTEFVTRFIDIAQITSINEAIFRASKQMGMSKVDGNLLWRHCTWKRYIEIDITKPLEISSPLKIGGRAIMDAISTELFGEVLLQQGK